jgi:hypothetical protein
MAAVKNLISFKKHHNLKKNFFGIFSLEILAEFAIFGHLGHSAV